MIMLWLRVVLKINLNLLICLNLHLEVFKETRSWRPRSRRCSNTPWRIRRRARAQPRAWSRWGGCAAARWG